MNLGCGEPSVLTALCVAVKMLLEACKLPPTSITLGAAAPTPLPILGAGAAAALAALAAL